MENIESYLTQKQSGDEIIFNEDMNMLTCNNELDTYMNVPLSEVVQGELENANLTPQNDILSSYNNCEHSTFNMVDINLYDQSSGDKLNSASECGCDFEHKYSSYTSIVPCCETDEHVRSSGSSVMKKHKKDEITDNISFLNKEFSHDKFSDIQESDVMEKIVVKHKEREISNECVDYCSLEDRDMECGSENVAYLDNNELINVNSENCFSSSNEINEGSIFCQDVLKSGVKEVEHRHNECSLANDFFETVENINLNISEKQSNLKEAVEKLVDDVKESDFENRINALIEISDKNSKSIEEFKKKSENCIRQCRKFETISENLIGDCINTLAQASICYANWVSLHASDLKEIDTDLADIEAFIETSK